MVLICESQEVQELLDTYTARANRYAQDDDRSLQLAGSSFVRLHDEIRRLDDILGEELKAGRRPRRATLRELLALLDKLRHEAGRAVANINGREAVLARDRRRIQEAREREASDD